MNPGPSGGEMYVFAFNRRSTDDAMFDSSVFSLSVKGCCPGIGMNELDGCCWIMGLTLIGRVDGVALRVQVMKCSGLKSASKGIGFD